MGGKGKERGRYLDGVVNNLLAWGRWSVRLKVGGSRGNRTGGSTFDLVALVEVFEDLRRGRCTASESLPLVGANMVSPTFRHLVVKVLGDIDGLWRCQSLHSSPRKQPSTHRVRTTTTPLLCQQALHLVF